LVYVGVVLLIRVIEIVLMELFLNLTRFKKRIKITDIFFLLLGLPVHIYLGLLFCKIFLRLLC